MKRKYILIAFVLIFVSLFLVFKFPMAQSNNKKGLAFFQKQDYLHAEVNFKRALFFEHNYKDAIINLVRTQLMLNKTNESKAGIDRLIAIAPHEASTFELYGQWLIKTKDYAGAAEQFKNAIEIDSTRSEAYYYRAIARANLNDLSGAASDYLKAQSFDKSNVEAMKQGAALYSRLENYQAAIENYNKLLELDPSNAEAFLQRGNFKMKIGDFTNAIEDFNKTITLKPDNSEAYFNRGISNAKSQNFEKAIKDFEEAINKKYKTAGANSNLGLAYLNLKQPDNAEKYLQSYLKENPRDNNTANALQLLGTLELMKNNNLQAIKYFTRSLQIDSVNKETYFNRGLAHGYLKEYQKAFDDLNKCILLGYNSADVYFARGVQNINLKDFKSGCNDFTKAADLGYVQAKDMLLMYCK
jgi:tetratricopeptide (TPR) repeat protein